MDEDEEIYREMNSEDPFYMGDDDDDFLEDQEERRQKTRAPKEKEKEKAQEDDPGLKMRRRIGCFIAAFSASLVVASYLLTRNL